MFDAPPVRRIDPCALGKWLNTLNESDAENLNVWLDTDVKVVRHVDIVRMVQSEAGKTFDKATVSDHRLHKCRCALVR